MEYTKPFIATLNSIADDMKKKGIAVKSLSSGDPQYVPEQIKEILSKPMPDSVFNYSGLGGSPLTRKVISEFVYKQYEQVSTVDNIAITNGASEGLFQTLNVITSPNDVVGVPEPCWEYLPKIIENVSCRYITFDFLHEFKLVDKCYKALVKRYCDWVFKSKLKVVVLNFPLNPTGFCLPTEEMSDVINNLTDRNVFVVLDDVTVDIVFEKKYLRKYNERSNNSKVITVGSFSKSLGLTGMRLGYVISEKRLSEQIGLSSLYSTMYQNSISQFVIAKYLSLDSSYWTGFINSKVDFLKKQCGLIASKFKDITGRDLINPSGGLYPVNTIWTD